MQRDDRQRGDTFNRAMGRIAWLPPLHSSARGVNILYTSRRIGQDTLCTLPLDLLDRIGDHNYNPLSRDPVEPVIERFDTDVM